MELGYCENGKKGEAGLLWKHEEGAKWGYCGNVKKGGAGLL